MGNRTRLPFGLSRMGGLLDDYLKDWQSFKEQHNPGLVSHGTTPPPTSGGPIPPSVLQSFCHLIDEFNKAPTWSQAKTDAIQAFLTLLKNQTKNTKTQYDIRHYVEENCKNSSEFFYELAVWDSEQYHKNQPPAGPRPPYQPPTAPPVASQDVFSPYFRIRRPPTPTGQGTPPPVPTIRPSPTAPTPIPTSAPMPVPTPSSSSLRPPVPTPSAATSMMPPSAPPLRPSVATPSGGGGPGSCPPGQFWDGTKCRGAISLPGGLPGIPGGLPEGGGGAVPFTSLGFRPRTPSLRGWGSPPMPFGASQNQWENPYTWNPGGPPAVQTGPYQPASAGGLPSIPGAPGGMNPEAGSYPGGMPPMIAGLRRESMGNRGSALPPSAGRTYSGCRSGSCGTGGRR